MDKQARHGAEQEPEEGCGSSRRKAKQRDGGGTDFEIHSKKEGLSEDNVRWKAAI